MFRDEAETAYCDLTARVTEVLITLQSLETQVADVMLTLAEIRNSLRKEP